MHIAITGAAGNLGGILARHVLVATDARLSLLIHKREVGEDLCGNTRVSVHRCDLARPETMAGALAGADCVVHFAGVLFKARPERFLPTTNTQYFRNLLEAAVAQKVRRVILISFPHVEGESTPDNPARGVSMAAQNPRMPGQGSMRNACSSNLQPNTPSSPSRCESAWSMATVS